MGLFHWVYEMGIVSRQKAALPGRLTENHNHSQAQHLSLFIGILICVCLINVFFIYPTTSADIFPDGIQSIPRTYANADPEAAIFPEGPIAAGFLMLFIAATIFSRNQKEKQGLVKPETQTQTQTQTPLKPKLKPKLVQLQPVSPKRTGKSKKSKQAKSNTIGKSQPASLEKPKPDTRRILAPVVNVAVPAKVEAAKKVKVDVEVDVVKIRAEKPMKPAGSRPKKDHEPTEVSRPQRKKRLATSTSEPIRIPAATSVSKPRKQSPSKQSPSKAQPNPARDPANARSIPKPLKQSHIPKHTGKPAAKPEQQTLTKTQRTTTTTTAPSTCAHANVQVDVNVNVNVSVNHDLSRGEARNRTEKVCRGSSWTGHCQGRESRAYSLPLQHEALRKRRGHPDYLDHASHVSSAPSQSQSHSNGRNKSSSLYTSEYRLRPSRSESVHGRMESGGGEQLELFSFLQRIGMEIYFGLLSSKKINFATMLAMTEYEFETNFELPLYAKRRIWKGLKEWQWTGGRRRSIDSCSHASYHGVGMGSNAVVAGQCYYESKCGNGVDVNMSQLEALATGMTSAVLD